MTSRQLGFSAALLGITLVLAGCSGDDGAAPAPTTGTSPAAASSSAAAEVTPPPSSTARPSAGVSPKSPVKLGEPASLAPDVTVRVTRTSRVSLNAKGPGEVAGPGAKVTIRVTNTSTKPVDLGALAVNAYYGRAKTPASPSSYQAGEQLSGSLKPDASRTGAYFFRVPTARFGDLMVEVSSGDSPYVLNFVGR